MRRRDLLILAGAASAWPLGASGQKTAGMKRIAVVMSGIASDPEGVARGEALRKGLEELGWAEGRNLKLEWHWAGGDVAVMHDLAAEIVRSAPDLILANSTPVLAAVQRATRSIPIVFVIVNDPVAQGFIASLAHPGGNTTGFTFVEYAMIGKWQEMLTGLAPGVTRIALLFNPDSTPYYETFLRSYTAAQPTIPVEIEAARIHAGAEIEPFIERFGANPGGGLIVPPDAFTVVNRAPILRAAARHRVPAIYAYRQFVSEGGLMSYGPDTTDIFQRSAAYVDRILKGANPADLPAQSPTKFALVINVTSAKSLGLTVPTNLLALADEVIE